VSIYSEELLLATEAQILANRRNAQKSTSPRTLSMSLGLAAAKRFAKTSALGDLIMQNKANLLDAQMNISSVLTKDYENKPLRRRRENKPNQTQFPPNPDNFNPQFLLSSCLRVWCDNQPQSPPQKSHNFQESVKLRLSLIDSSS